MSLLITSLIKRKKNKQQKKKRKKGRLTINEFVQTRIPITLKILIYKSENLIVQLLNLVKWLLQYYSYFSQERYMFVQMLRLQN